MLNLRDLATQENINIRDEARHAEEIARRYAIEWQHDPTTRRADVIPSPELDPDESGDVTDDDPVIYLMAVGVPESFANQCQRHVSTIGELRAASADGRWLTWPMLGPVSRRKISDALKVVKQTRKQ